MDFDKKTKREEIKEGKTADSFDVCRVLMVEFTEILLCHMCSKIH